MANQHGDFIWYELMTGNPDAAGKFYGAVIGWTSHPSGQPGMDYRLFSTGNGSNPADNVGGQMAITAEMAAHGARSTWIGYIGVDDIDASVAAIAAAGGAVLMPAWDIVGIGRMAMVADPAGAPFYVMKGASNEPSRAFAAMEPGTGHCAWNELATDDPEAAIGFYAAQFGWRKDGEFDMGPMGTYHMMAASGERFMIAGIMRKVPEDPNPHWLYYFRVDDIDAATGRIIAHGGRIHIEATAVPGGDYALSGADPEGAFFGLVGPRREH